MTTDALQGVELVDEPGENPTLETLNALSGERRLFAALAVATVALCVPASVALALMMPQHASVMVAPPPVAPKAVQRPAPQPTPATPVAPVAEPMKVATPAPAPVVTPKPTPAPVVTKQATAPVVAKPVRAKRVKKAAEVNDEIWPESLPPPRDVRLADPADGPGGDDLKRPTF